MISRWSAFASVALVACSDPPGLASPPTGAGGGGGAGEGESTVCEARAGHRPVAIHGGDRTMLAVMDDGTLYCWRENGLGQCDADEYGVLFDFPRRVRNLPCVTKAAAGSVGVAMTAAGIAYTWGIELSNDRGDGDVAAPAPTVPTRLSLGKVTDVSANGTAIGAVAGEKTYWWGYTQQRAAAPTPIGVDGAADVSMDVAVSCLRDADGKVACWGGASANTLGPGQGPSDVPIPMRLDGPAQTVEVAARTACVVLVNQEVQCWGSNGYGTLGRGADATEPDDPIAMPIEAAGPFAGIALANGTACAWRPTGEVLCWGNNAVGLYAPNDSTPTSEPRRVPELEPAKQVAVVYDEVCSLGFDDVVRCRIGEPDPEKPQQARVLKFEGEPPRPE